MKLLVRSIILYFPIVFIYKLFGNPENNYHINSYWFFISINYIFMFIGIRKVLSSLNFVQEETIYIYRRITLIVAFYWGVMAIIRLYLYFNIYKHSEIISSAGQMTTGSVCIALIFIYLTAKKWFKK